MINTRDEQTMMDMILRIAQDDDRVRAVIMNGSRASPGAAKDKFQDYDIVYVVTDVEAFVNDPQWITQFGDPLIIQTPDVIDGNWSGRKDQFSYLMQFKDWNRIDLTLLHQDAQPAMHRDSQSILLLDKDGLTSPFPPPSDADYLPQSPTAKQFHDCVNEFLWVSTYVAKGLWRKELIYAKNTSEQIVKEQLIKLLIWYAAMKTNFDVSMGKFGKHINKYIEPALWEHFVKTYVDADEVHMWGALFDMCELFNTVAVKVAFHYGYTYNQKEYEEVVAYLKAVQQDSLKQTDR